METCRMRRISITLWLFSYRSWKARRSQGCLGLLMWATKYMAVGATGKEYVWGHRSWIYLGTVLASGGEQTILSWFSLSTHFSFLINHFSHFKPHNSMTFSLFTMFCNHDHYLIPEHLHHLKRETSYPLNSHSPLPFHPAHIGSYGLCLFWIFHTNEITSNMWPFVSGMHDCS